MAETQIQELGTPNSQWAAVQPLGGPSQRAGGRGAVGIRSRWGEGANWRCWTLLPLCEKQQAWGSEPGALWREWQVASSRPGRSWSPVTGDLPVTRTGAGMRRGSHFYRSEPHQAGQPLVAFRPQRLLERYGPVPLHGWLPTTSSG